jgi:hypothetical protein
MTGPSKGIASPAVRPALLLVGLGSLGLLAGIALLVRYLW